MIVVLMFGGIFFSNAREWWETESTKEAASVYGRGVHLVTDLGAVPAQPVDSVQSTQNGLDFEILKLALQAELDELK